MLQYFPLRFAAIAFPESINHTRAAFATSFRVVKSRRIQLIICHSLSSRRWIYSCGFLPSCRFLIAFPKFDTGNVPEPTELEGFSSSNTYSIIASMKFPQQRYQLFEVDCYVPCLFRPDMHVGRRKAAGCRKATTTFTH